MALWIEKNNTLYPFCLYTYGQYSKQPPDKEIEKWLEVLVKKLEAPAGPS